MFGGIDNVIKRPFGIKDFHEGLFSKPNSQNGGSGLSCNCFAITLFKVESNVLLPGLRKGRAPYGL
jgi:hypothetical protein